MRWFDGLAAVAIAGVSAYLVAQAPLRELEGTAYDLLLRARHEIYGPAGGGRQGPPASSPVVVIALDRETALRPPFDRLPQELWTPQIAGVVNRVLAGGARIVAQQDVFTATANDTLPHYDAHYLAVLARGAQQGRIVLGRRAPAPDRLGPAPEIIAAAGGDRNVRRIALYPDADGVLRHAALYESSHDVTGTVSRNPSLALELAARVIGERPHLLNGSTLLLGRYPVPGSEDNAMLLNFRGGRGGIPVFSLGDLHACDEAGDAAFFRKHFDDKVVLIGRSDVPRVRRVTAARFLDSAPQTRDAERCRLPVMQSLVGLENGGDMAEVEVSATAVRNLLQRDAVKTLPQSVALLASALLALATALAVTRIALALVAPGVLVVLGGWGYLAVVMLARENWLMPLAQPAGAVVIAFAAAWAFRRLRGRGLRLRRA